MVQHFTSSSSSSTSYKNGAVSAANTKYCTDASVKYSTHEIEAAEKRVD